ncbi:hypothetical protein [Virgibacillus halodenitrificans]|uniref:hypothetical protein n=1 Tax=Virgibacillus halodenitrificans TaxID=1482 RepID=UPI001F35F67B|nr:hypothetical protein [Virgibacillus halodenitrificans]MCJ0931392.1 hypothetical protein [Virgibacillus halodenitrificans]
MNEISSYQIYLNNKIPTKDIIRIHQLAVESSYNIYLYRDSAIADARNLPKLISFFFLSSKKKNIKLIIDGEDAKNCYKEIKQILDNHIEAQLRAEHKVYNNQSIVV